MIRQLVPIVLLLSLAGVSQAAPPLEVREDLQRVSLLPYGELLVDETAQLTIDEVSTIAAGFQPIEGRLVREPSDSAYWIRFELRNSSPREVAAVVEITNMRIPLATLFLPARDGRYTAMTVSRGRGTRVIDIRHTAFPMTVSPNESLTAYLRLYAPGDGLATPVELSGANSYYGRVEAISLWLGFFYGVMAMFALYNLLLLLVSRDTTYLWYFVAGMALLLTFLGADELPFLRGLVVPDFAYLGGAYAIATLLFTRRFLRTADEAPGIDVVLKLAIGGVVLDLLLVSLDLDLDLPVAPVLFSCLLVATIVRARQGFTPAWLILAVWMPPIVFSIVPFTFGGEYGLSVVLMYNLAKGAVLWERVGSSLAVGVRLGILQRQGIELDRIAQAEQKQRLETQQRYERLVENSPFGIAMFDNALRIEHVNSAFTRILDFDAMPFVGSQLDDSRLQIPAPFLSAVRQCIETGRAEISAQEVQRPEGQALNLRAHLVPVHGSDGRILGCQLLIEDVTEEHSLRDQLHQAQKLEAVARLAGGVAHDLNNYLTSILGFAELLLAKEDDPEEEQESLEIILDAARRSAGVTRQLLAFGRREVISPRVVAVGPLVIEIRRLLESMVGEDVALSVDAPDPDLRVRIDPSQLEQVLMNLVVNARDAMPYGGQIRIAVLAGRDTDREVAISVSDTGDGIDAETQKHIFDPFFTTKEVGKGTGLGLATVHGIVTANGGEVEVESEPGEGTTLRLFLPRSFEEVDPDEADVRLDAVLGRDVLVVDDDDGVRALVRQVLKHMGHRVRAARSGWEALAMVANGEKHFDLLITDVVMPEMGGLELRERLGEHLPELAVLYLTGYSERNELAEIESAGDRLLSKPFSPSQLTAATQRALDPA